MNYPTEQEVKDASRAQLCSWWRFLPSPGTHAIGKPEFNEVMLAEGKIMDLIAERFKEVGGFTPAISKAIGWGKP